MLALLAILFAKTHAIGRLAIDILGAADDGSALAVVELVTHGGAEREDEGGFGHLRPRSIDSSRGRGLRLMQLCVNGKDALNATHQKLPTCQRKSAKLAFTRWLSDDGTRNEGQSAMRSIGLLCAVSLLAGCAASGVKVTEEQAESFKVGVSSYNDVVTSLGQPTSTSLSSNGTRTAVYTYAAVRSQAQNFIPYIGGFVAGYDTQKSDVAFTFDQRGTLTNMSSTQTGIGTGANLAAGANAATTPYQGVR